MSSPLTVVLFLLIHKLPAIPPSTHPQIMGPLIDLMDDPMVQVRDSAVWTLGRVCEQVPAAVLSEQNEQQEIKEQKEQYLLKLLDGLCRGLQGEPRVATNSCWVRM